MDTTGAKQDVNDRLRMGTLPRDPMADAVPMSEPSAPPASGARANVVKLRRQQTPSLVRGDHVELATMLLRQLSAAGPVAFDEGQLYRYDPTTGIWSVVVESEQSRIVQGFAGARVACDAKPLRIGAPDASGAMRLARDQAAQPGFFVAAPPGLAFTDRFVMVDAKGLVIEKHAPENRARAGYDFPFSADAKTEKWTQFLRDLFADDDDADDKIACVQEFAGACLLGIATRYQRALIARGHGADGKSKLITVLMASMPKGTCAAIPPQQWDCEYRRAMLAGIRFNAVSELPETEILASEPVKAIIAGDLIDARPIHRDPFCFQPISGHLFAANRLPGATDTTHGFWRRWIVLAFCRRFAEDEQNKGIAEEIIAAERPGVVTWMLSGAQRLLKEGTYTIPKSAAAELERWRERANSVSLFLKEKAVRTDDRSSWTKATPLYKSYRSYCEDAGLSPVSKPKFSDRMTDLGAGSTRGSEGMLYPVSVSYGL